MNMKVRFLVDEIVEGYKCGSTKNPLYFYGNINKVVGLMQIFKEELKKYPPDTAVNMTLPMYNFISLVRFNIPDNEVMMFLFDAENDESIANELFDSLTRNDAPIQLKENFKQVFDNIRADYDNLKGVAELQYMER
jgi:hypothetical protein